MKREDTTMQKLYEVTYSFPSASGFRTVRRIENLSREQAADVCERIESLDGYRLHDLNRQF